MIEIPVGFIVGFLVGLVSGWWAIWVNTRRPKAEAPPKPSDEALIVKVLTEKGASEVHDIRVSMKDITRGAHDWWDKSDSALYRALNRLESEGTITRRLNRYGTRHEYELTAPRERLIAVS